MAATATVLLLGLAPLPAQSCLDDWRRPVVCSFELRSSEDGRSWETLRPGRRLEIAAGERTELEIRAEDQFGWDFPEDRLVFVLDLDRDCDDLVSVEDEGRGRYRISAGSRRGRCSALLWIPGNLNLEREIEIEVQSRAKAGYEWEQARFITRGLYRGLLGREPDREGWDAATLEVQRGRLDSQVRAMVRSPEFLSRKRTLSPPDILSFLYRGLLGREPDSDGVRTYLRKVERGRITDVILDMIRSPEFEERMLRDTRIHATE